MKKGLKELDLKGLRVTGVKAAKPKAPEMVVKGVTVTEYQYGIPIEGWDNVKGALNTFSRGLQRRSLSNEVRQVQAIANAEGVFAAGLYTSLIPHPDSGDSFVEGMLESAKPVVDSRGFWAKHFEQGPGSFFKTNVEIDSLPEVQDSFLLRLRAAYSGDKIERELAEHLQVERGLLWKNVAVEVRPDRDLFTLDFDQVLARVQPVVAELNPQPQRIGKDSNHTQMIEKTGEAVVQYLTGGLQDDGSYRAFRLGEKDGVEVSLSARPVSDRFIYEQDTTPRDTWHIDGAKITGRLTDSQVTTRMVPPYVNFEIAPVRQNEFRRLPAVRPEMKATMNDLAVRIADSFTK